MAGGKINRGSLWLQRDFQDDWKWPNIHYRSAWLWLMVKAAYEDRPELGLKRGQLWFSLNWAKKEWGMSKTYAQKFLIRCEKEVDIIWERGVGGRRNGSQGTVEGTVL